MWALPTPALPGADPREEQNTRHSMAAMTHAELRNQFPSYWVQGTGNFAVVCSSGRRITLCQSEEQAREMQHSNCGRNCDRYTNPHSGHRLQVPQEKPAPAVARRPVVVGWGE